MSEWKGLHNPERHTEMPLGIYGCWHCARNGDPHEDCTPEWPCYCCLAAEVEALRAQVQRVRELRDRFRDHEKWVSYRNVETLLTRALDGDA